MTIYEPTKQAFEFHPGPIFAAIVLADEINRASPKTQSASSRSWRRVASPSTARRTRSASRSPIIRDAEPHRAGRHLLPEAQLDRFLMKSSVGYPDHEATIAVLADAKTRDRAKQLQPLIASNVIVDMARLADEIHVDPAILGYVSRIAEESPPSSLKLGLSVRGCLAYVRCAKTWAASQGRTYVIPDDIKILAEPVLSHRLLLSAEAQFAGATVEHVIDQILGDIAPPAERASA